MKNFFEENHASLLNELEYAFVSSIKFDAAVIRLDFILNGYEVASLQLSKVVHVVLSQTLNDEGAYAVGELSLVPVNDGGTEVLTSLSYRFFDRGGKVFSYPEDKLFHFHLEGDICLEVVCGSYQFNKVVSR